jgi:putative FmdB family regulatory protein
MPTYEYGCEACGKKWEAEQRITEAAIKKCPKCGKLKAKRLISGGTFMLKGGGWYADGYGSKKSSASPSTSSESKGEGSSKADASSKADSGSKGEAKSETKAAAKSEAKSEKSSSSSTSGASDS